MPTDSGIQPWEGIDHGKLCQKTTPVLPSEGVIPTVVIANTGDANGAQADPDEFRGIVFHGYEPVEWYYIAPDKVDSFKTWVACRFPSVQIVTPGAMTCGIICPPPPVTQPGRSAPGENAETTEAGNSAETLSPHDLVKLVELVEADARACAKKWFVAPPPQQQQQPKD